MNQPENPQVTVLLCVYNGEKTILQAVNSILSQSFQDFELLIIDDGSTDHTVDLLIGYSRRIRLIRESHKGLVGCLNLGIQMAHGEYIARMDADDISAPNRVKTQVEFLNRHPEIGIVGSIALLIDTKDQVIGRIPVPESDLEIRWAILFQCPMIHPSVMLRRKLLIEQKLFYSSDFIHAEDYDLWTKLIKTTKFYNIQLPLLYYRIHPTSVTKINREISDQNQICISRRTIQTEFPQEKIDEDAVCNLARVVCAGIRAEKDLFFCRAKLSGLYFDLWDLFYDRYKQADGIRAARINVVIKGCKLVFIPPLQKGAGEKIKRIWMIDRNWVWILIISMFDSLKTFIKREKIQKPFQTSGIN